ncbi:MAG: acyl carrier protein [Pyrinomonadaceae bacterium]
MELNDKVTTLLAEVLQIPETAVNEDLAMKDLATWDSLKHMELVVLIEQSFKIELTFDEIVAMQNVREIKRVLAQRELNGVSG